MKSYWKNEKNVFTFFLDTCGFTPISNLKKKCLSKTYKRKALGRNTIQAFWKCLKEEGKIEEYFNSVGDCVKYLKLGNSHYNVDLLKRVNLFLNEGSVFAEEVWKPSRRNKVLFVELSNDWFLLVAPCDLKGFERK